MALFDFPRIHFTGEVDINVATINNAATFPLTIYDATRSRPFLPPRLYFSSESIIQNVRPTINPTIQQDPVNGYYYIEIEPINTIALLRTWCMTPLCSDPAVPDQAYRPYYAAAENDQALQPHLKLLDHCPGYWNMYGDMSVTMKNMYGSSIQTCERDPVTRQFEIKQYTSDTPNLSPQLATLLDSTLDFDAQAQTGNSTASMCETVSNQSVFAYVFCNVVNVTDRHDPNNFRFQGTPYRFQPLLYGTWKVLNWVPPMAASCRFSAAIPLADTDPAWSSPLADFLRQRRPDPSRAIKGLLVSFTIEQVFEYRYNQRYYLENGTRPNPVRCTSSCTITPWYADEPRSALLGRYLVAQGCENILQTPIPMQFSPALSALTPLPDGTAIYSLDMGNTWPEAMVPAPVDRSFTPPYGSVSFETYDLGSLSLQAGGQTFATLSVNETDTPLRQVLARGSLFDWHITDPAQLATLQDQLIELYLGSQKVLTETPYYITSDEKGLYGEQGDLPTDGYQCYDEQREPCRLRILSKGQPVTQPIALTLARWDAPEAGNDPLAGPNQTSQVLLKDGDIVSLHQQALELNNNAIYYFAYPNQYPGNQIPNFANAAGNYTIFDTGAFVVMRVHPYKDYSSYLNPHNWATTPPDWDVVYREVFQLYDVVYPIMSEIHPWTEANWNNGYMAGLVVQRTDPSLWSKITYMPRTRELSRSQRSLLQAWANYLKTDYA